MTAETFFAQVITALERVQIPYMVTGSFASSAHGQVRGTRDIDVVIAPTPEQLRAEILIVSSGKSPQPRRSS